MEKLVYKKKLSEYFEKIKKFTISNKWLSLIVILIAGLGLSIGYTLIPLIEHTQTASVLVSTNNTNNSIVNTTTQNKTNNTSSAQPAIYGGDTRQAPGGVSRDTQSYCYCHPQ